MDAKTLIGQNHAKGGGELTHRNLKDFGFEKLPFKGFGANQALYYLMVMACNLLKWFKADILEGLVKQTSYATTVRRVAIDFAGKLVRTGRKIILKVTESTMKRLRLDELWQRCNQVQRLVS